MRQYFKYGILQIVFSILFFYFYYLIFRGSRVLFNTSFGVLVLFFTFFSIKNILKFREFSNLSGLKKEHSNFLISVSTTLSIIFASLFFFENGTFLVYSLVFLVFIVCSLYVSLYVEEGKIHFRKESLKLISFSIIYILFFSLILFDFFIFIKEP
jgi:hypothetical protein